MHTVLTCESTLTSATFTVCDDVILLLKTYPFPTLDAVPFFQSHPYHFTSILIPNHSTGSHECETHNKNSRKKIVLRLYCYFAHPLFKHQQLIKLGHFIRLLTWTFFWQDTSQASVFQISEHITVLTEAFHESSAVHSITPRALIEAYRWCE